MRPYRVVILADGASVHTRRWIEGLAQSGRFELYLISMNPKTLSADEFSHVHRVYKIAPSTIAEKGGNYHYLFKLIQIRRIVREIRPDLISTLYITSYGFIGALVKGRAKLMHFALGTDIMVTPERSRLTRWLTRFALWRADFVMSASQTMTARLIQRFRFPSQKILTQQYGVTQSVIDFPRAERRYDFVSNRQWIRNSNPDYIMDVLAAIPHASLAMIGRVVPGSEALGEKVLQACQKRAHCTLFPGLPYEQNIATVSQSRFLISLTSSDGAALSVMEAMALGTVPILSDIPPNREWVENNYNGFLLPLDDLEEARRRFMQAYSLHEDQWQEMSRLGREVICQRGSLNTNMGRVANLMTSLIEQRPVVPRLKVLILGNAQSVHVQRWVREISERQMDAICISLSPLPAGFHPASRYVRGRMPLQLLRAVLTTRNLIGREKPDILHAHYIGSYGLIATLSCFKPTVLSAWGSDLLLTARRNWLNGWIFRCMLRRATAIFCDSYELIDVAQKIARRKLNVFHVLWGVPSDHMRTQHVFSSRQARHFISLRMHEKPYCLDVILKAFAQAKLPSSVRLTMAGAGTLTDQLKDLAKDLGISDRVFFPGLLTELQVAELLRQGDVSISVPLSDGTAMSVLESMAAGLPLICSRLKANSEWLDENGAVFVAPSSVAELAAAYERFASGDLDLMEMGEHNRKIVNETANREKHFKRIQDIYEMISQRQEYKAEAMSLTTAPSNDLLPKS